jgi:hypothetical protein
MLGVTMNNRWVIVLCVLALIGGTVMGWFVHSTIFESELSSCQSELTNLKKHSTLKLSYDPYTSPAYYNVSGIFRIALSVSYAWPEIRGNITNLTTSTMNTILLLCIPRYPDNSLDVGTFIENTRIEVLLSGQTKEFDLHFIDLEDNQPFDLLLVY